MFVGVFHHLLLEVLDDLGQSGKVHALGALEATSLTKVSMFAFNLESLMQAAGFGKLAFPD